MLYSRLFVLKKTKYLHGQYLEPQKPDWSNVDCRLSLFVEYRDAWVLMEDGAVGPRALPQALLCSAFSLDLKTCSEQAKTKPVTKLFIRQGFGGR